jgi:hypothetical protein
MERGPNFPTFETSSETGSDDSKETKKNKKKKSAESTPAPKSKETGAETPDRVEVVVDKGKSVWEEVLHKKDKNESFIDNKADKTDDSPERTAETPEEHVELPEKFEAQATPEEERQFTIELVDARLEETHAELQETTDPEEIVVHKAAIAELEAVKAEAATSEPTVEASVEALENEPTDDPEPEASETSAGDYATEDEPLPFEDEDDIPLGSAAGPKGSSSGRGSAGGSSSSGGSGSGAGGATPPPPPPIPPMPGPGGGTGGPAGPGRGPAAGGSGFAFNRAPNPNVVPVSVQSQESRPNRNLQHLLVGGIVGYLIGRRRGRIKTEKRMNVVIKKLEKQVEAKQQEINYRVDAAERKAREAYRAATVAPTAGPEKAEKPILPFIKERPRWTERPIAAAPERTPDLPKSRPDRPVTAPPERIRPSVAAERSPKNVELRDEDVMRISETINIGATNLRQVYEAKLVTRSGLRRLVSEHLEGRDIRRGLAREFLAKELSYERDPRLRDIPEQTAAASGGGTAATAVSDSGDLPSDTADTTVSAAQSTPVQPSTIDRQQQSQEADRKPVSTGLLTVLTIIALGLAAYAVMLGLAR